MFQVGQRVIFGRSNGEKTVGTVLKINAKSIKIKQEEARGGYAVGTEWRVHPNCVKPYNKENLFEEDALRLLGPSPEKVPQVKGLRVGDRVSFEAKGRTIFGTVKRVNTKTVAVVPDNAPEDRYWRVSPGFVTKLPKEG